MGCVEIVAAEPSRQWRIFVREKRKDFARARIAKAPTLPFIAYRKAIINKVRERPFPHFYSRVITPAVVGDCEGFENLDGFDALLAETAGVETSSGMAEIREWEKGLHG